MTYDETLAERRRLAAESKKLVKDDLLAKAAEFFARRPDAEFISWTQYTPYFNDGDVCSFGVHEAMVTEAAVDDYEPDDEASNIVSAYDDDDLQAAFGDGYRVTIRRDLFIEIEKHSHD